MSAVETLTCFKAYDVRGKLDEELNEEIAYRMKYIDAEHLKMLAEPLKKNDYGKYLLKII